MIYVIGIHKNRIKQCKHGYEKTIKNSTIEKAQNMPKKQWLINVVSTAATDMLSGCVRVSSAAEHCVEKSG